MKGIFCNGNIFLSVKREVHLVLAYVEHLQPTKLSMLSVRESNFFFFISHLVFVLDEFSFSDYPEFFFFLIWLLLWS